MWYLEQFDLETDELAQEYLLQEIDDPTLRRILNIQDSDPIEPFSLEVANLAAFENLTQYIRVSDIPSYQPEKYSYFVDFWIESRGDGAVG